MRVCLLLGELGMLGFLRRAKARKLLKSGAPRRIRIHSVRSAPPEGGKTEFLRVAFEFIDPPGPWSMQFYEAVANQAEISGQLVPDAEAIFFESEDGARSRLLATKDRQPLWPR